MARQGLTPKQERFVAEYLTDLNATQAAIRAGYSARNADKIGPELLGKTRVAAAIATGRKKLADKAGVTAERIVTELAKLGFSNMQDYVSVTADGSPFVDLSAVDRDKWAAVGELTVDHFTKRGETDKEDSRVIERVKFKLLDKRAALVDLGKHLGMFVEKTENKTDVTVHNAVDRPARETREQWVARRSRELGIDPRLMGAAAGAAD